MTKVILVSKTMTDRNYIDHLIEENPPQDIKDLTFFNQMERDPEQLMIYLARVSSPKQRNPDFAALLRSCWKRNHVSVFEQVLCSMEIETDIAISKQILRHKSFFFQELSRRYSSDGVDFFTYKARTQDTKNRQSTLDNSTKEDKLWFDVAQHNTAVDAKKRYEECIQRGIGKELCRYLLPMSTKTKLYMTGTLRSWIHYIKVREKEDTQKEHREVALLAKKQIKLAFPVTYKAVWGEDEQG